MPGKRHSPEQILRKLREVEVALSQGETVARAVRQIAVTEQTYYRWRNEYGGLSIDQARKLKKLELENARLKRAVADGSVRTQRLPRDQVELNTGWIEIFMQPTRSLEPTIFQRKSLVDWTLGSVHHPPT